MSLATTCPCPITGSGGRRSLRVGIGGPVGSGKTALVAALCRTLGPQLQLAVVTNDIYTTEDADFLRRSGAIAPERVAAVETGCCPHTAVRDDISANLDAVEDLEHRFAPLDLVLVESGGDNLTMTFSRGLVDVQMFVIDVAGGDKVPRKGGPGVTTSDLLVINKTDLAERVGADLGVMARDAERMRKGAPVMFTSLTEQPSAPACRGLGRDGDGPAVVPLTSRARAVAEHREGRTVLRTLRSEVPLSLRPTADGLTVVASAFGPLGGDSTEVEVVLEPGARLDVGSAGAQVAQPGVACAVSRASVVLHVGAGADLRWRPQPLVVSAGAEHRADVVADVDEGGRLLLVETAVLRPGGRYRSRWRVAYAGTPLLASDLDVGEGAPAGWDGPAVVGDARVLVNALLVGHDVPTGPCPGGEVFALAGPGALLQWVGDDPVAAARAVDALAATLS